MNDNITGASITERSGNASPPIWFWVITVFSLLWYLMDMSAFFMRVYMIDEIIISMPENQQHLYQSMPLWVNVVFALEVFGGVFGSVGLLLRKKWALPLFIFSIIGVLGQTFHVYFLSDAISVMGAAAVIMPLVAILIGGGMIVLTKFAISRGWMKA